MIGGDFGMAFGDVLIFEDMAGVWTDEASTAETWTNQASTAETWTDQTSSAETWTKVDPP